MTYRMILFLLPYQPCLYRQQRYREHKSYRKHFFQQMNSAAQNPQKAHRQGRGSVLHLKCRPQGALPQTPKGTESTQIVRYVIKSIAYKTFIPVIKIILFKKKEIILYNTHKSVYDVTIFCLKPPYQSKNNIFCNTSSKSNSVFLIQKIPGVAGDLAQYFLFRLYFTILASCTFLPLMVLGAEPLSRRIILY